MDWRNGFHAPRVTLLPADPKSEEWQASWHITTRLFDLEMYADCFGAAVSLLDFLERREAELTANRHLRPERPRHGFDASALEQERDSHARLAELNGSWKSIAARDGVITIYHFGEVFESIRVELRKCSPLDDLVDHGALEKAKMLLRAHFGTREHLRHAVAHSAEERSSLEDVKQNSVYHPVKIGPFQFDGNGRASYTILDGRTFHVSHKRTGLKLDLTDTKLQKLFEIRDVIFSAFKPAEKMIWDRSR